MEDLQLVLFVLGAIAIIAVLLHGVWSIKKDNKAKASLRDAPKGAFNQDPDRRDRDGFDDLGLGPVVVKGANNSAQVDEGAISPERTLEPQVYERDSHVKQSSLSSSNEAVIDPLVATNDSQDDFNLSHEPSEKRRQEPVIRPVSVQDDSIEQMPLDLGETRPQETSSVAPKVEEVKAVKEEEELGEPQDVLALHLVAKEGQTLHGSELLPCLLALNFKFGEMSIFHRHQDNAGTGKVIFSMANMVKPGVFDPDTMEQFTTPGVVLFLTLPCYGDALMNFSNMLNSAQQLADDLDALVLDGQRQPWTETIKFEYVQRIKALKL